MISEFRGKDQMALLPPCYGKKKVILIIHFKFPGALIRSLPPALPIYEKFSSALIRPILFDNPHKELQDESQRLSMLLKTRSIKNRP